MSFEDVIYILAAFGLGFVAAYGIAEMTGAV